MPSNDAFVESDKFRRAVFTEIAAGEADPDRIAKKHRLIKPAVTRAITDLEEHGLIQDTGEGTYELTDEGQRFDEERRRREKGL